VHFQWGHHIRVVAPAHDLDVAPLRDQYLVHSAACD